MISNMVGRYLLKRGLISSKQLQTVLAQRQNVHVRLGLVAVSEGLMTQEETEEVHRLQKVVDKRFGELAVEKGYLTEGEVEALLNKQGSPYLALAQVLENQHLLSIEELEQYMAEFQSDYNLTISDMEDLKSNDIDRILPLCMPLGCEKYLNYAGAALRAIVRWVDLEIYIDKAYVTRRAEEDNGAVQLVDGEKKIYCAMAGKGDALLELASTFGVEKFTEMNRDALDSVGELLNCIDGIYARNLSQGGIATKMYPPEYSEKLSAMASEEMLVLPLFISGRRIDFIIAIECAIEMEQEA